LFVCIFNFLLPLVVNKDVHIATEVQLFNAAGDKINTFAYRRDARIPITL